MEDEFLKELEELSQGSEESADLQDNQSFLSQEAVPLSA
jgi:hypothetical protein